MSTSQTSAGTRVVHVSTHYPPFLGGLEKVVETLVAGRREQGLAVRVLTSSERQAKAEICADSAWVRRFRCFQVARTPIMPGLLPELLRIPRGSVMHLHVSQAFLPEMVNIAHHLRRLPYVAHVHIDAGPAEHDGLAVRAYKSLVLGRVLRAAATVVVFTEEQRLSVASNYDVPLTRIAVVPNGVDSAFFHNEQRILHPKPRLLYVGRLSVEKNLPLLLQALDGVSEQFETTLVGDGELDAVLRAAATRRGLHNVRFYGRAHGAELRELYRQADAFVLPSAREGMPLVLLEALAMGLPIIATDIPGTREIVRPGENGILVPLGDPRALRQGLLDVTGDPERYRKMSETSRQLAEGYSWEVVSAEFERLYARPRRIQDRPGSHHGRRYLLLPRHSFSWSRRFPRRPAGGGRG